MDALLTVVDDVDFDSLAWALSELQREPQLSKHLFDLRKLAMLPLADGRLARDAEQPLDASDAL